MLFSFDVAPGQDFGGVKHNPGDYGRCTHRQGGAPRLTTFFITESEKQNPFDTDETHVSL